MTPYYAEPGITIYCADCRDVLPQIWGASLLLTDPPYGISYRSNHNSGWRDPAHVRWARSENFPGIVGDDAPLDPSHLYQAAPLAAIFGGNYCAPALGPSRCWLVWDKRVDTAPDNQSDCELIWTNFNAPCRIYRHLWRGIIRAGEENVSISVKLHPHQKPIGLLQWIIRQSGIARGPVLDPYCGSGSTLVAARRLGFEAVGIEIERKYCDIAIDRLRREILPLEPGATPIPVRYPKRTMTSPRDKRTL
jgi:site-specific DNA-methyltransferase (adenine-specific)/modification methylase